MYIHVHVYVCIVTVDLSSKFTGICLYLLITQIHNQGPSWGINIKNNNIIMIITKSFSYDTYAHSNVGYLKPIIYMYMQYKNVFPESKIECF